MVHQSLGVFHHVQYGRSRSPHHSVDSGRDQRLPVTALDGGPVIVAMNFAKRERPEVAECVCRDVVVGRPLSDIELPFESTTTGKRHRPAPPRRVPSSRTRPKLALYSARLSALERSSENTLWPQHQGCQPLHGCMNSTGDITMWVVPSPPGARIGQCPLSAATLIEPSS